MLYEVATKQVFTHDCESCTLKHPSILPMKEFYLLKQGAVRAATFILIDNYVTLLDIWNGCAYCLYRSQ